MKRVSAVGTGSAGSPFFWQFYFDAGGAGQSASEMTDWVAQLFFGFRDQFSSSLLITTDAYVDTIDPITGEITTQEAVTPGAAGGLATDLCPLMTQGLLRYRTNVFVGGRRLQGRTFLPTPPESANQSNGTPSAAYTADVLAAYDATVAGHPGVDHAVYSRTHRVVADVANRDGANNWAYLRSRRD